MIIFNFHNSYNWVKELISIAINNIAEVIQIELHRAQTQTLGLDSNV